MRAGSPNREKLLFILILFVVSLTLLVPGETWFQSRALCQLLIFAGCGAAFLVPGGAARRTGLYLLFVLIFVPSMLFTTCAGRSWETLALWFSYFCLFLLVRALRPDGRQVDQAITLVCLVASLMLLYALHQHFTDFGGLTGAVADHTTLTEGQRADMLSRLASGRLFSTFPLPTTFAEIVVIILPLMVYRFRTGGRQRYLWSLPLLLSLFVLPRTGSFGILPVLACLGLVAVLARADRWSPGRRAAAAGGLLALAAIVFLLVLQVRGFTPWDPGQAHNPVSQRLFNWRSAVSILNEHPLAGVGPGNFGVAYARHRLPGANETVVAHNSYLQLLAEGGLLPGAALILLALLLGWRIVRRLLEGKGEQRERALYYSVLALLVYGGFEITVEFPGIGYPGVFFAALASLSLFPPRGTSESPWARSASVLIGVLLIAGFGWSVLWYGGRMKLEQAVSLAADGPGARAASVEAAESAGRWNPLDPEPPAFRGALLLAAGREQEDPDLLRKAGEAFGLAIALDPERAFHHDRMSVVHQELGEWLPAFLEADRASRLHPLEPMYGNRRKALLQSGGGGA